MNLYEFKEMEELESDEFQIEANQYYQSVGIQTNEELTCPNFSCPHHNLKASLLLDFETMKNELFDLHLLYQSLDEKLDAVDTKNSEEMSNELLHVRINKSEFFKCLSFIALCVSMIYLIK